MLQLAIVHWRCNKDPMAALRPYKHRSQSDDDAKFAVLFHLLKMAPIFFVVSLLFLVKSFHW